MSVPSLFNWSALLQLIIGQETADVPVPADAAPRLQSDNSVPVVVSPTEPPEARRSLRAAKKPERLIEQL